MRAVAALVLAAALAGCGGMRRSVSEQFLVPRTEWVAEPSDLGLAFENVEIATGEETSVFGWFIPADGGDGRTVLFCHGNAANISFYHPFYAFLHSQGWNVLIFDYRGYGKSKGDRDVRALFSDCEAMLDYALAREDVDPKRIVLYGASLGSIVALRTAARRPEVKAVVVENATSPHKVLRDEIGWFAAFLVETFALPGGMECAANARRIRRPMLFLCGARDRDLVPHLEAFLAAPGPAACWVLPDTGHAPSPLLVHDGEYQDQIALFLDAAVEGRAPRVAATFERGKDALHVQLTRRDLPEGPLAVEVAVVDREGKTTFVDRWMDATEETWEIPFEGKPFSVTAWRYLRVAREGDTFVRTPGPLAAAADARATLLSAGEIVAESIDPLPAARAFVETVAYFEARGPFPALLETELIPAYLAAGRALYASPEPKDRDAGRALLERCVAAAPGKPGLHYWPATNYTVGFRHEGDVEEARRLLAGPPGPP